MTTKRWMVVAACALAAAIAIGFTVFRPSEEDRIRKVLDRFAAVVSIKPDTNVMLRAANVKSGTKELVTDDIHVDVAETSMRIGSREQLVEQATAAATIYSSADVTFTGLTIKVDDHAISAKVDGTALVTGDRGGEHHADKRAVHFLLRKDGDWRITSINVASPSLD